MDREALDIAYNNRAVVPDWQGYLDRWAVSGAKTYEKVTHRDMHYGDGPRQRMDLFLRDEADAPTCLFLHGGYWQWNDKEGQALVAEGLLPNGISAAIGEYSLAPDASMTEICEEAVAQVSFLSKELARQGRNPNNIYLTGISTGAHLMALALGLDCVRGALLISGIYDLEPIRISSLNAPINMDMLEARLNSPLHMVPTRVSPLILAHGGLERPEIQRQSKDYCDVLNGLGHEVDLMPVAGTDHFSVLETLISPTGVLSQALVGLVERTRLA
ncbi:alpha/beta hydrolase [Devosia sp. UYZn731]|uniref:alpha/beta hydrolase n=1 Tax=Devosia sp. UYZn731 TaxID=3156345 RepID=UPI003393AF1C